MAVADLPQPSQVAGRGHDHPTRAENRLDNHGSDALCAELDDPLLEGDAPADRAGTRVAGGSGGAAIGVGGRDLEDVRRLDPEISVVGVEPGGGGGDPGKTVVAAVMGKDDR